MRAAIAFLFAALIVFLMFALCGWSLNPGHWGGFWRGLWIVVTVFIGISTLTNLDKFKD